MNAFSQTWTLSLFYLYKLIRVGVSNKNCLPGKLIQLLSYHFPCIISLLLSKMFVKLVSSGSTLPVLCCLTANNVSVDVERRRGCDWFPAVWLQHWGHQCPSEGKINICKHGKRWCQKKMYPQNVTHSWLRPYLFSPAFFKKKKICLRSAVIHTVDHSVFLSGVCSLLLKSERVCRGWVRGWDNNSCVQAQGHVLRDYEWFLCKKKKKKVCPCPNMGFCSPAAAAVAAV